MDPDKLATFPAPTQLADGELLQRLQEIQRRTRELIMKYQIQPGAFSVMARRARQAISNSDELCELFELLINLQEYGAEAKQRAVLADASTEAEGEKAAKAGSPRAAAPAQKPAATPEKPGAETLPPAGGTAAGEVEVDEKLSEDFFRDLDS